MMKIDLNYFYLKVDLVIYDFTMGPCILGFVHKFGNPAIVGVSPYYSPGRSVLTSGSLIYPAFVPGHVLLYPVEMNFFQRVSSTLVHVLELLMSKYSHVPKNDKLVRKFHPNMPYLEDIEKNIKLYLINTQPLTDYKLPVFSNHRLVGGAQIKKPKDLPAGLKEIADSAKNGIVLFSLGTNVRSDTLGDERIVKIIKAFGKLKKFTFLWKFETKEKLPTELPKNVIIQSWMPQNDVLAHPNTKLFVSHCGLLSTQEALWYGVPVLGFPVFADQPQNALRLKELGVSETLSIENFTEDELYNTIKKLLEDPKYQNNIKSISSALRDQPMTPIEEATYWSEWTMRHPNIDLRSPAVDVNILIRHSLDVFVFLLFITLVICYINFKIIKFVIKYFLRDKSQKIDNSKKIN
jgi:glucuronosyltransferase